MHLTKFRLLLGISIAIICLMLSSGTVLAVSYSGSSYINLLAGYQYYGAGFTEASAIVSWISVRDVGEEVCWTSTTDWDITRTLYNDWIVGADGQASYNAYPCSPVSGLYINNWHSAPGWSSFTSAKFEPHPFGIWP
jgi:hypothetical protein